MVAFPDLGGSEGVRGSDVSVEMCVNSIWGFGIVARLVSLIRGRRHVKDSMLISPASNSVFRDLSNHHSDTADLIKVKTCRKLRVRKFRIYTGICQGCARS